MAAATSEKHATDTSTQVRHERWQLVGQLHRALERPMVVLGFVWLGLFVYDVAFGLPPFLDRVSALIWILFVADFLLEFIIAPDKWAFLKRNWLTILSLAVPALRIFSLARAFRLTGALRATRGARMVGFLGTTNRSFRSLRATMGHSGFGYVMAVLLLVLIIGAAGIYQFEKNVAAEGRPHDFGSALWWTAMVLTTMGSDYFPKTAEGRLLCLGLAIFGFTVSGYVAATLASFLVGKDVARGAAQSMPAMDQTLRDLREEIAALRAELRALADRASSEREPS